MYNTISNNIPIFKELMRIEHENCQINLKVHSKSKQEIRMSSSKIRLKWSLIFSWRVDNEELPPENQNHLGAKRIKISWKKDSLHLYYGGPLNKSLKMLEEIRNYFQKFCWYAQVSKANTVIDGGNMNR